MLDAVVVVEVVGAKHRVGIVAQYFGKLLGRLASSALDAENYWKFGRHHAAQQETGTAARKSVDIEVWGALQKAGRIQSDSSGRY